MNTACDLEVQEHGPNAMVVYGLIHVIAKYGREVICRVRVDCANKLKHDNPARRRVKRGRWILLNNRSNLNEKQAGYLEELLAANKDLMVVYIMKEQLKDLWYYRSEDEAKKLWEIWWQQVMESGVQPLIHFA